MKSIYYLVNYIGFLLNKSAYYKSKQEIVDAIDHAQLGLFIEKLGNTAKYQVSHPIPPVSYQITKKVSEDLRPFLNEQTLTLTASKFILPTGFVYPTSLRKSQGGRKIDVVDDDKVAQRLESQLLEVSEDYPIAEILNNGYRVYPSTLTSVYLKYLRTPVKPIYAVTIDVNDNEVYNDAASVDVEWSALAQEELIARALPALGLNLKDAGVINFGNYRTQQGN